MFSKAFIRHLKRLAKYAESSTDYRVLESARQVMKVVHKEEKKPNTKTE